jgi:hypothetical protein
MTLARRIAAEAVGTAFLLAAVVGSGIVRIMPSPFFRILADYAPNRRS